MPKDRYITTIQETQEYVKQFAKEMGWKDLPNLDKFDHLHEELVEMSQHLRYKNEIEKIKTLKELKHEFSDGIGDLFFGLLRLANQLGVDVEKAFNEAKTKITSKYNKPGKEHKITSQRF